MLTVKISGNLEAFREETGPISSQRACRQGGDLWGPALQGSPGSYLGTSPGGLCQSRRAHKLGGLRHFRGTPEALKASQGRWLWKPSFSTLCFPWSQESQFILKTPNGTPVMNTCISRNLLLVPPKIQFLKSVITQKGGVCVGGVLGGFF